MAHARTHVNDWPVTWHVNYAGGRPGVIVERARLVPDA
jgi:hypothetical protein